MKIICDCGNEMKFNTIDEDTGEQTTDHDDGEGQYASTDISKFAFWQAHDIVGIACEKCDKAVWIFT